MSESTNEPAASIPSPPSSPQKKAVKGKWRRRIRRTLIALILIVLALRIALFFAIRPVLHKVAAAYDLDISFGRQEMTLSAADVGFWYIKVTPKSGGPPIFSTDYLRGRISTWDLLKGRLYVYRAEADGVDLTLERTKEGRLPVLEQIMASHSATPAPPPKTEPEKPLDFTSPLKVEAFRLSHVRAHILDESVTPPLEALLAMDVRVSYLGQIDRPAQFEADIWSDPVLDLTRVIGQFSNKGQNLDATLGVFVRGLHLKPLAGYLATVGVRPYQNDLGLKMSATLKTEPSSESQDGVKATLAIDRIDVTSESQPVASVQSVNVEASDIEPKLAKISAIVVNGVRAHASRSDDGLIRVAGLELVGGGTPHPPSPPSQSPFQVSVRDVAIRDVQADLHDAAVSPPTDMKFVLSEATSKSEGIDPSNPESIVPINVAMSVPGLVRSITLNGKLKPFAADKAIDATFTAEGIKPEAAHGYLAPFGVESLLKDARGEGKLSATIHPQSIDAQISDLTLSDGTTLVSMPQVQITSLGKDPTTGRTRIADIELTGPAIDVTRDSTGRFTAAGFRYDPSAIAPSKPTSQSVAVASAAPTTKPSLADSLPKIQIDRVNWSGVRLHLRDEQTKPPTTIAIDDAGIEGADLVLDLTSNAPAKPGTLKLHMSSPSLAKQLSLETTVQPSTKNLSATFAVRGAGVNLRPLAPYLVPLGIEPTLHDATLQVDGNVGVASERNRLVATLALSSTKLTEGSAILGGLDQLHVDELALANDGTISVKSVEIKHPQIDVSRDEHGVLSALGVRLVPTTRPTNARTAVATTAPAQQSGPPQVATLDELKIEDAAVNWNDRVPSTPVALHAHATLLASKLVVGKKAQPASFRATIAVDDLLKELVAAGRIDASPGATSAIASIDGKGIGGHAIAPYLPPGMELATQDGRFKAEIQADLSKPPQGGTSAKLVVQHLNWRDGGTPNPLFAFDAFTLDAPRIDPAANIITINEVSLAGLTTHAELAKDGSTQALGLVIRPQKQSRVAKETLVANNVQLAAAMVAPANETNVSKLVIEERRPLPLITLKKLDVNVRSAKVQNLAMPDAAPLELQDVRLHNPQPIVVGGPDAANEPPVMIDLTGKVAPVVGSFDVKLAATPFATSPAGTIDLSAAGIRGAGVTELIPTLKKQLNGDGLTDGRLSAQLATQIKFDRRGPRDFDLSRGFQADVLIDKMQFRDGETGPILAGLESIRADQVRVEPKNGSVFAKLIELSNPKLTAVRDADGIHALGFVIPIKSESTTQPTTASESTQPEPEPTIATPVATAAPTTKPAGEIRVVRLTLTGLDVRVEDRTVAPPTIVPLNNLDLEVRDFTTRALVEPRMMHFALTMSADKVPLPVPEKQRGGIVGAFGAIGSREKEKEPTTRGTENRELLSQISAAGSIGLYPKLSGYVKGSMNGIELAGFEGEAKQGGVDLTGGVFDGTFDVRFADNGDIVTKSKFVFNDLKVDEPAGGPLSKGLKLPVPLNATVGALQDVSGAITVPVNVTLAQGKLTGGEIMGAVAGAIAPIVGTAVTNAPLKAVAGAGDIIGVGALLGKDKKKQPREPIVIQFSAGSLELDPASKQQISAFIEEAQRDDKLQLTIRHELGGQDVPVLAARANPSPEDCQALASQLRTRKAELARQRDELSSQVEAQLASHSGPAANSSVTQLRDLDRESAHIEISLDQLYDLLRPGADRQADRRTRKAALDLGQARVDAIKKLFIDAKLPHATERVQTPAPRADVAAPDAPGRVTIAITGAKR